LFIVTSPATAIIARVASPKTEPICTNQANQNPCNKPHRAVSEATIPGRALKAIARAKEGKSNNSIGINRRPRELPRPPTRKRTEY
jgi:hypothetical protein